MNWKILYRYVQGQCSEEELSELGHWLQEHTANENFFTSFIEDWEETKEIRLQTDDQVAWNEFKAKYSIPGTAAEPQRNVSNQLRISGKKQGVKNRKKRRVAYWAYVAATVTILSVTLFFLVRQQIILNSVVQEQVVQYQEINTVKGQRSNLKLSDGSVVFLNSSTTLKIPQDYGQETRTLYLEGEAFFEVEHDSDRSFRVHTRDDIYMEVIGTRFNVQSYENGGQHSNVNVTVAEGRVRLGSENENQPNLVEVSAGQKGAIGYAGVISVVDIPAIEMDAYLGWVEGRMVFNDQPLEEIIKVLERWYDIDVTVTDPELLQRRMSATFQGDPLTEVLQVISQALQIDFTHKQRQVQFFL